MLAEMLLRNISRARKVNLKMYFYIGAAIALGLLLWRFEYLSSKVTSQKLEIDQGIAREASYRLSIERQDEQILLYNKKETTYLKAIEDGKNENDSIRKQLVAGTHVLRVAATFPAMPKTSADTATTIASTAEFSREAEEDYLDYTKAQELVQKNLSFCIESMKADRR